MALVAGLLAESAALRGELRGGAATRNATAVGAKPTSAEPSRPTAAELEALRGRLKKLSAGLEDMLSKEHGTVVKSKVAPALRAFQDQLQKTLKETADMKDTAAAAKKLQDAEAGVGVLMNDIASQQESLMKEEEASKKSLLLAVLMRARSKSMDEQLKIVTRGDFAGLDVSHALVVHHDQKIPLLEQAAGWLDSHGQQELVRRVKGLAENKTELLAHIQGASARLQKRVEALEQQEKEGKERHAKMMKELEAEESKAKTKQERHQLELIKKREERRFEKWAAACEHDIEGLRTAVSAVESGNLEALEKAQQALKKSLQAMRKQTGGFLHLLQLGHTVLRRDCPYCAAQCVDKCHQAGKSYVTCLADCADAGKGK